MAKRVQVLNFQAHSLAISFHASIRPEVQKKLGNLSLFSMFKPLLPRSLTTDIIIKKSLHFPYQAPTRTFCVAYQSLFFYCSPLRVLPLVCIGVIIAGSKATGASLTLGPAKSVVVSPTVSRCFTVLTRHHVAGGASLTRNTPLGRKRVK